MEIYMKFIIINILFFPVFFICIPNIFKCILNKKQRDLNFKLSLFYLWVVLFANCYGICITFK